MLLLMRVFDPKTIDGLMCCHQISIDLQGRIAIAARLWLQSTHRSWRTKACFALQRGSING